MGLYNGSLTREQFMFREMRIVARLYKNGLSNAEITDTVYRDNLFQYPTERVITKNCRAALNRLACIACSQTLLDMDIKVSGSDIRLNYQSIVYAEHFSHMIHIHTPAKKTLITRLPFKSFIAPLCQDARFFVCGRGVIVNLEHAADFEDTAFIMDEGSRVFFSRELMKSARQAFMVFLLQRGH